MTVASKDRQCVFGEVVDNVMRLNGYGSIAAECWKWLEEKYAYVEIDEWVVMPNHLHGIIMSTDDSRRGGSRTAPTEATRKSLGRLIGAFKTVSTKRINRVRDRRGVPVWQRDYYEHVIRSDSELDRVRRYIVDNPASWSLDVDNPDSNEVAILPP